MHFRLQYLALTAALTAGVVSGAVQPDHSTRAKLLDSYARLPLQFEANRGQTDRAVQYLARGRAYTLFLTPDEAVISLGRAQGKNVEAAANLRMRLVGANRSPALSGRNAMPGRVSYFRGNTAAAWHTGVSTWGKVEYAQVYPGIDLVFYGNQDQFEFDFVAAPGADASVIRFRVEGAKSRVDANGDLMLQAGSERLTMRRPVVYQGEGAVRRQVAGRFVLAGHSEIRFQLGAYDHSLPLVIDPTLTYASYLGGAQDNRLYGLAVNSNGEAYVAGSTMAANFPASDGGIQQKASVCAPADCTITSGSDAFVARISADGTQLVYATYLGGNSADEALAIAVDADGNAYVTGDTYSNDFPLMNPYQKLCSPTGQFDLTALRFTSLIHGCESHPPGEPRVYSAGVPDVFIAKIDPTGTQLLYSTYFGGSGNDAATGIGLDADGNIYIAGSTSSIYRPDAGFYPSGQFVAYPVSASAFETSVPATNTQNANYFMGFVAKFSPDGQTLLYSSVLGGVAARSTGLGQSLTSMAVGQNGVVGIGGVVYGPGFPVQNAINGSCPLNQNGSGACYTSGFIAAIDTTQSGPASLIYSSYLTGTVPTGAITQVNGVAMDALNNLFATGSTQAHDFPATAGTLSPGCTTSDETRVCNDSFVLKVDPAGNLIWSTYFGTGVAVCPAVTAYAVTADSTGNVYLAGNTLGCGVPVANPFQARLPGANAFLAAFSPDGSQLLFGSYFGGTGAETPTGIAVDAAGNIYFAGHTTSADLPGTAGAFEASNPGPGYHIGFVGKVSLTDGGAASAAGRAPR